VAKVKYDNTNVEPSQFKQPTPGLYTAKIDEANHRSDDGHNDIEVVFVIDGGEFDGAKVWTYVGLSEASGWKLLELTDALGLPKKGELDTNKIVNKKVKIKINPDQWEGEYRARVGRISPLTATPEDDAEVEAETDSEETATEEASAEEAADYSEWEVAELLEVITDDSALAEKYPGGYDEDRDYLTGFLEAADANELDEWLAENSETVDYTTWDTAELKAELERRGLDVPKRAPKSKLIGLLEENDGDGSDPFESE